MKIVNLDGYTTNPGDLSWDGIKRFGDYTVYDRTAMLTRLLKEQRAQIFL